MILCVDFVVQGVVLSPWCRRFVGQLSRGREQIVGDRLVSCPDTYSPIQGEVLTKLPRKLEFSEENVEEDRSRYARSN